MCDRCVSEEQHFHFPTRCVWLCEMCYSQWENLYRQIKDRPKTEIRKIFKHWVKDHDIKVKTTFIFR